MSEEAAQAAIERMESDEALARRVKEAGESGGADGAISVLRSEGFDVSPGDMRDAAIDRFSDEMTPDQLDALTGGVDPGVAIGAGIAGGLVIVGVAAMAAAV